MAHGTNEKASISYEKFVDSEIMYWRNKGIEWKYAPKHDHDSDDTKNDQKELAYTDAVVEDLIMTVYKTTMNCQGSSEFVKLLLLFTHQTVIGRIFASWAQIPDSVREKMDKEDASVVTTSMDVLNWKWKEYGNQQNTEVVVMDFRRVYLIFLTNYLNRIWQFYHVDVEKENVSMESDEYAFIQCIKESLDEIISSTMTSTKTQVKLSKSMVFERITENCCSLCGGILDSLRFKYPPICITSLQQLYNMMSLIALQINVLYRPVEQKWIDSPQNYKFDPLKHNQGDENFVTLVINNNDVTSNVGNK
mmetsp:Transcript_43426/g.71720  ORF Transcript_43426/g.71720 Transcript_43426/m.71720 type:complete len:306 (+) Transcript_43426:34-951(+)